MWPESTTEMFVDSYLDSPTDSRQTFLIGTHTNWISMPETIPVTTQLEILLALKAKVAMDVDSSEGTFVPYSHAQTANEMETIDHVIARLDCPQGAEMILKLRKPDHYHEMSQSKTDNYESYDRMKWACSIGPHFYQMDNRNWREDRFDILVDHKDPKLRIYALRLIQHRPIPRYMPALKDLEKDENPEVRNRAIEVIEFLEALRHPRTESNSE